MQTSVIDEVRGILDGTSSPRGATQVTEDREPQLSERSPLDEAYELVRDHRELVADLHRRTDRLATAMGEAWRDTQLSTRTQREAMEGLRVKVLPALNELRDFVDGAIKHAEEVAGAQGTRVPREISDRLDQLDAGLLAVNEGRKPAYDKAPSNAGVNDYSADLIAATREAEDAIGVISQLKIGSSVAIGRKKLQVSAAPTQKDDRWMVDLTAKDASGAFGASGDAYTLIVSEGKIELHRGEHILEMTPADLYISEQYGSHMYGYPDYTQAQGKKTKFGTVWIAPGDNVNLGGEVFRVVATHDSGALIQPKNLASTPKGASLAGTQVAKYDPHRGQYSFVSSSMPGGYEMADTIQVVGHEPNAPKAVGETISFEDFEAIEEAKGSGVIAKLRTIVKDHQHAKVGGVMVDATTANMLMKVHEALSPENQAKFSGLPIRKMVAIGWKLVK